MADEDEPIFPMNVVHAQQQTDETAEMFEKYLKENADLREKLANQTCGVSMIKENNECTSFYTTIMECFFTSVSLPFTICYTCSLT